MTSPTALLFRQQFRREICDGTYVMHIANSGDGLRAVE